MAPGSSGYGPLRDLPDWSFVGEPKSPPPSPHIWAPFLLTPPPFSWPRPLSPGPTPFLLAPPPFAHSVPIGPFCWVWLRPPPASHFIIPRGHAPLLSHAPFFYSHAPFTPALPIGPFRVAWLRPRNSSIHSPEALLAKPRPFPYGHAPFIGPTPPSHTLFLLVHLGAVSPPRPPISSPICSP